MITPEKFGNILDKFPKPKIELAKIELALKDDIKSSVQKHNKIIQKLESEIKIIKNIQKNYNTSLDLDFKNRKALADQNKKFKKLDNAQKKVNGRAEKIAKELGVQVTDISNWSQFDNIVAEGFKVFDEARQRIKEL